MNNTYDLKSVVFIFGGKGIKPIEDDGEIKTLEFKECKCLYCEECLPSGGKS